MNNVTPGHNIGLVANTVKRRSTNTFMLESIQTCGFMNISMKYVDVFFPPIISLAFRRLEDQKYTRDSTLI